MKKLFTLKKITILNFLFIFILCSLFNNLSFGQTFYSATDSVTNPPTFPSTFPYTNNAKGFKFSPDTTISIHQLGKYIPNTLGNYTWTIWDLEDSTLLHLQVSLNNVADTYTYEPINNTLILSKNKVYAIVLHCDATPGAMFYINPFPPVQMNTHLTYINALTRDNSTPNIYSFTNNPGLHMGFTDFHFCIAGASTDYQVACDSYTWIDGNTYTESNNSANYIIPGAAANGCDSIITLDLTINNSNTGTDTQTACDTYTWIDGNTYTTSNNTATHTLTNISGCDSIVTLNLTINNSNTGTDNQVACNTYTWIDGNTYTTSNNTATHTLTNILGCDSVVTLNLTINNSSTKVDTQTACETYTWIDGNTYTTNNNTATHTILGGAANGCDSIITLNLTINNTNTGTDTQTACETYTWIDGNTYTTNNNTATHTLTNISGCDSIVTLNLTINNSNTGTDTQTACDTYTWIDGNTYTTSNNTATHTLTNILGCDSVVTLNLTINNSNTGTDTQTACDTYTWIDGNTYTMSNNTATHTLTNISGCDSIVTLNLTINNSNTGTDNQVACNTYTWIDGNTYTTSNNTATHTLTNILGCDSVVTLNLTINNSNTGTDNQTACDTYTWIDGNTYTNSNNTATHTLTNILGCDSVVTLNLTINRSNTGTDTQTACDTYTWIDGNTYTTNNNTATHTLTNISGCDSVVTLNLTINNSNTGTDTQTACDTYTWIDGNTYTADNNTATHTLTNIAGCDSIITLNLTINNSNTGTDNQTACDTYTWIDGNTYTNSNNTATHTLTNILGCDSVVTLNLTINSSLTYSQTPTICEGSEFIVGTNSYTTSGTYTDILTSINGCDSTVTTILTVEAEIDTYVERINTLFKVSPISGANYQWVDCNNGYSPIAGATNPNYTATEPGNYAVIINNTACTDTSICNELPYIIGLDKKEEKTISIYPNPVRDIITVELDTDHNSSSLSIIDITGKIVYSQDIKNETKLSISTENFENGLYFIRLENQTETIQFIKQ